MYRYVIHFKKSFQLLLGFCSVQSEVFGFLSSNVSFSSLDMEFWEEIYWHKYNTVDEKQGSKSCIFDFDCEHGHRCDKVSNLCQGMAFNSKQFLTFIKV